MSSLADALAAESLDQDVAGQDAVNQDIKINLDNLKILEDAPTTKPEAPVDIFSKSILLKLDMGRLGTSKKLGASLIEVDADKDRISAAKSILESPQLDAIKTEMSLVSKKIRNMCLPSVIFKRGTYLVPIASVAEVNQILEESQAAILGQLVPAFLEAYPGLVEADKLSLRGGTYNPADYPPISKVEASFVMDWDYISIGVPEKLQSVDSSIFVRQQEKSAARLSAAVDEIQDILRAQMLELVTHLADQMSGEKGESGKRKALKTASVVNVTKFIEAFRAKNITDDKELDALCEQAKSLLEGVDPQAIRDSITVKDRVITGFQEIKASLDTLMVNKPSRMIKFAKPEEEGE